MSAAQRPRSPRPCRKRRARLSQCPTESATDWVVRLHHTSSNRESMASEKRDTKLMQVLPAQCKISISYRSRRQKPPRAEEICSPDLHQRLLHAKKVERLVRKGNQAIVYNHIKGMNLAGSKKSHFQHIKDEDGNLRQQQEAILGRWKGTSTNC